MFHIGTARTAYFSWLAARATGGQFILRIDDTDQNRHQEDAVKMIYDSMQWLDLDFDKTFRQSDNLELYKTTANILVNNDLAFYDDQSIRLRISDNLPDFWTDNVAGKIAITDKDKQSIDNLVIIKSDGWPTYHFSSVIDDIMSGVNYVIRGNDHTSNTGKQISIYKQLEKVKAPEGLGATLVVNFINCLL